MPKSTRILDMAADSRDPSYLLPKAGRHIGFNAGFASMIPVNCVGGMIRGRPIGDWMRVEKQLESAWRKAPRLIRYPITIFGSERQQEFYDDRTIEHTTRKMIRVCRTITCPSSERSFHLQALCQMKITNQRDCYRLSVMASVITESLKRNNSAEILSTMPNRRM